ncbi:broad substrate specificity ATP-binding cassette transporter ABCG2 isoform X2 [Castor canadensis]|uniref:ATP-binding cassette sub-family G member 2-like isoform X2 n=1 Tax=Castor canadensis TaxID=51338 RepID=A0A8B7UMW6_CASCN|nr:ATP-binding cassette sub-family G member 2-like isoform X2 [Castor canadensis]
MCSSNDQVSISLSEGDTSDPPGTTSSDMKTVPKEAVLSFRITSYRVKQKIGFLHGRKTVEIEVLSNINGIMKPGLNAIMGPPGGGKSLLLDVLAARKDPHGLSGDVLINGAPRPANFRSISGYVLQEDVVMDSLTVRENLQFSAALRLPTTMTNAEKNERINMVIKELGLDAVADFKVRASRERKRTMIGMELITDHPILFLDEPTTGLDSSTASTVLWILKKKAKQGCTIIFSIHQPQYSIFRLFDSLTLVASGKLMFHGPAQEALGYFESAGYQCGTHNNPADFFLDVINGDFSGVASNREEEDFEANETEEFVKTKKPVIGQLVEFYINSSFYRETKTKLDKLSGVHEAKSLAFKEITYVTSFCDQLRWIIWRSFKNYLGFPQVTFIQTLITVALGLIVGASFVGLKSECTEVQNRASLLFLLTVFQCITSVSSGELFVLEQKLFIHEHISGYYRMLPYFFGKLISELIPRRLLPSIIFTFILYFMVGLNPSGKAFFTMIFTVLMLGYSASSVSLSFGAGENAVSIPTLLVTIYFVFMLYFSGLSLFFGTILPGLSWLQYFSVPHYGFRALQHNELLGQNFCPDLNTAESNSCPNYVICTGEEFLRMQNIDLSPWGLWKNHVAMASMMIIFLTITFLQLLYFNKNNLGLGVRLKW